VIALSPLATLMVLVAPDKSSFLFYVHLGGFGAWTIAAVVAGVELLRDMDRRQA
jgi:hypothetical protein